VGAVADKSEIPLSAGEIGFIEGKPSYVQGVCNVNNRGAILSGIPGRLKLVICEGYEDQGYPATNRQCMFCKHWGGADYEEVLKALIKYEGRTPESRPAQQQPPENRFSVIDIVMAGD
jgi:hypothetical protein